MLTGDLMRPDEYNYTVSAKLTCVHPLDEAALTVVGKVKALLRYFSIHSPISTATCLKECHPLGWTKETECYWWCGTKADLLYLHSELT